MDNTPETIIDFIRHGELVGERMYRDNRIDHPLSKAGWQQMLETISQQYLRAPSDNEHRWDLIVSSPLLHCYSFAEVLSH